MPAEVGEQSGSKNAVNERVLANREFTVREQFRERTRGAEKVKKPRVRRSR